MIDHNAQHHISTNQVPAIVVWLIRASFAAIGPEHLTVIELMMNSSVDKNIVDSNLGTSVQQLKAAETGSCKKMVIPKNSSKSIKHG